MGRGSSPRAPFGAVAAVALGLHQGALVGAVDQVRPARDRRRANSRRRPQTKWVMRPRFSLVERLTSSRVRSALAHCPRRRTLPATISASGRMMRESRRPARDHRLLLELVLHGAGDQAQHLVARIEMAVGTVEGLEEWSISAMTSAKGSRRRVGLVDRLPASPRNGGGWRGRSEGRSRASARVVSRAARRMTDLVGAVAAARFELGSCRMTSSAGRHHQRLDPGAGAGRCRSAGARHSVMAVEPPVIDLAGDSARLIDQVPGRGHRSRPALASYRAFGLTSKSLRCR